MAIKSFEEAAAEFLALDEQEQEVALHEARLIAIDPTPYRDMAWVLIQALRTVLAELDRKADLCEYETGYADGFGEGRDTTYPFNERRARLNELCRAQGFVLVHMAEPHKAAKRIAHRIAQLSNAGRPEMCMSAVPDYSGSAPEMCALEAGHDGRCRQ